jgi:hypothetical protein
LTAIILFVDIRARERQSSSVASKKVTFFEALLALQVQGETCHQDSLLVN